MNLNPGKTEFTDTEHADIRRQVEAIKATEGIPEAQIGREADVSASTLNSYLKGRYAGNNDPVGTALSKWLGARAAQAAMRQRLPQKPSYQPLFTSKRIMELMHYARAMKRLVVISGEPGLSKTSSARQYCADNPRAWLATMDETTAGLQPMLLEVLLALGMGDITGSPLQLSRKIGAKLSEADALLIIDETQHLSDKAIEQLRAINDRWAVGIVLLGNSAAYAKIGTAGTKAAFAQVSSRIAQRRYFMKPDERDVSALAHAYAAANQEELGQAELKYLQEVASKPGGLRNVEMTFEGALIAAHGEEQPLTVNHLRGAFANLSGLNRAA